MRRHLALTAAVCGIATWLFAAPPLALAQSPVVAAKATPRVAATPSPTPAPAIAAAQAVTPAVAPLPPEPPEPPAPPAPPQAVSAPPAPPAPPPPPQAAATPKPPAPPKPPRAPEPAPAPDPPQTLGRERVDTDPINVRIEVTISYQAGAAAPIRRTAILTVANGSGLGPLDRAMLRAGNSVPVPTTTFTPLPTSEGRDAPPAKPVTSFNYRSVGLNVDVRSAGVLPKNLVRTSLDIEFSGIDDKAASSAGAPSFPTFSQRMSLYLESGKPLVVAQSSDFVDNVERKQTVEVKATILR